MNANNDIITDYKLIPTNFQRHQLSEIASLILGIENDRREYWAEELDSERAYVEVNPYDGEDWDAALSVFVLGNFIGNILLRGTDLGASQ